MRPMYSGSARLPHSFLVLCSKVTKHVDANNFLFAFLARKTFAKEKKMVITRTQTENMATSAVQVASLTREIALAV